MTDPHPRPPRVLRLLDPHAVLPLARVFVVLVGLSLIAGVAWMIWNARSVQLEESQKETANLAYALARHAQDTVKKVDTMLVGLVERLDVDGMAPQALQRLQRLLRLLVDASPELHGLFAYDRDGRWLSSSFEQSAAAANTSDREYFRYHRDNPDRGPHIGAPVRSRITGAWVIPISRRLEDAHGRFAGVVLATVDMGYFQRFYGTFDINRRGALSLTLDNGTVLVRHPYMERLIGASLATGPIFREHLPRSPVGNATLTSVVDGEVRLYSYRHLEHYPLVATAALSQAEVLANWRQDAYVQLGVATALALLLGLLGFHLTRLIKAGLATEAELLGARDSLAALNQRLEKLALEDELTGLANRRQFMAALDEEVLRAARHQRPLALLMLDVDHFKQFNDLYGHSAGDQCLRSVAQVIRGGQKRPGDLAARYGGEEFCVLLPETDMAGALVVAEQIRQTLESQGLVHAGSPLGLVTLSAGVHALIPTGEAESAAQLLHCADRALYRAKAKGRNRVCGFDVSLFKEKL
ncbi:GGDEF domain-containing protein [Pseudomonas cavernae]|uniref:diguanylate cyclase n=1 Tax=Pseudomonas cavernae TaxID=2320867 RepID=A0A385YYY1_9PSED|nr:sensor domain-containing diguanylate cyclase [Pseudomonas cavernae]AYC31754.1 GGDEF domain-containing protein [Pseudomonas cavernae]